MSTFDNILDLLNEVEQKCPNPIADSDDVSRCMYSKEEIFEMAKKIMDTYETEDLEELMSGEEFKRAYYKAMRENPTASFHSVAMKKVVGEKLEYGGICIERYTDEYGGIKIICENDELMDRSCEDGVVFVAMAVEDTKYLLCLHSHGEWENVLARLAR